MESGGCLGGFGGKIGGSDGGWLWLVPDRSMAAKVRNTKRAGWWFPH